MTDSEDRQAMESVIAFINAVGIAVVALDEPRLGKPSSAKFVKILDEMLDEPLEDSIGSDPRERLQILRELLENAMTRTREHEKLRRMVDDVFGEGGS